MEPGDGVGSLAQKSQLFTVRFWPEELGSGQTDWRGKVQHVNSGEARYFRDLTSLIGFITEILRNQQEEKNSIG